MACRAVAEKLFKAAKKADGKALGKAKFDEVEFVDGAIRLKSDPSRAVGYGEIISAIGEQSIEAKATAKPSGDDKKARNAHMAVFAEVKVDVELGVVRVTRLVCAVAARSDHQSADRAQPDHRRRRDGHRNGAA